MLVYQLATFQSETIAQRSSKMYESTVSFLRRAVMPDELREQHDKKKPKKKHRHEERSRSPAPRSVEHPKLDPRSGVSRLQCDLPSVQPMTRKNGPKEAQESRAKWLASETALFSELSSTLKGILSADAVAIVSLSDYQLFVRRSTSAAPGADKRPYKGSDRDTKKCLVANFLQGSPWPKHMEPVVHFVPKEEKAGLQVFATETNEGAEFSFSEPGSEAVIAEYLKAWFKTRHFWYDKEDPEDDLGKRLIALMPNGTQTLLATAFMTYDGQMKFAAFAAWNRPPTTFGDSSVAALPYAWNTGWFALAALAIRRMRSMEQSQISYSNLQAQ